MKNESEEHPNLSVLRKILFWDTDINKIDWQKQYGAVIERVFERGNSLNLLMPKHILKQQLEKQLKHKKNQYVIPQTGLSFRRS